MALEPVPNVPLLEDPVKDSIFKRWLERLRTGADTSTSGLAAHLADTTDAHDASAISFTPAGTIAATNVQTALQELDTEKQAADTDLDTYAAFPLSNVLAFAAAYG